MSYSDRQSPSTLRLVVSAERQGYAPKSRAAGSHIKLVVDDRPREQLLRTMTLVATARRHAAHRLRTKVLAGRLAMVWLTGITAVVSLRLAWSAGELDPTAQRSLSMMSLLAIVGLMILVFRQTDDRSAAAARELETCVASIEALSAQLRRAGIGDADRVHDVRQRYTAALRQCRAIHKHSDYLAARGWLEGAHRGSIPARVRYAAEVYLRDIAIATLPVLVLAIS